MQVNKMITAFLFISAVSCTQHADEIENMSTQNTKPIDTQSMGRSASSEDAKIADKADRQKASAVSFKESAHWYDGQTKRTVYVNPGQLAEFSPSSNALESIKSQCPSAKALPCGQESVRLWQLPEFVRGDELIEQMGIHAPKALSPMIHDTASPSSQRRALPGNAIVVFNADWDKSQVDAWTGVNGTFILKELRGKKNTFLLKTDPGLPSLQWANAAFESGQVISASPVWWRDYVNK